MKKINNFWNDAAKYGALLGIAMSGSKVLEQSLLLKGEASYVGIYTIEWILSILVFGAILHFASKKRSMQYPEEVGYPFGVALSFIIAVSALAAIPVACVYYIYINSFIGYDVYVDMMINSITQMMSQVEIDAQTADLIDATLDTTFEQLKNTPQPSIFSSLFGTIANYIFGGALLGLLVANFTKRKPVIFGNNVEDNK